MLDVMCFTKPLSIVYTECDNVRNENIWNKGLKISISQNTWCESSKLYIQPSIHMSSIYTNVNICNSALCHTN